ncbi:MAG: flagellar FlbD family protein [Pirellulales bacterium]|nr:flagellar FlbD family protein [Pirellulales bacterium]
MIRLTRLNDDDFVLNAELIRYVEERPDTIITLTSGERVTVRESMQDVVQRTVEYHRSKFILPSPVSLESDAVALPQRHN